MSPEPVEIAPYDPRWPALFEEERRRIEKALRPRAVVVEHVGSTAIPGLSAKPILDIVVGMKDRRDVENYIELLEKLGYDYRGEAGVPGRLFLRKFEDGRRTHHLHLVECGGERWMHYLLFRDHLREHPATAREYARLKRGLAEKHRDDREAYTAAKTGFVAAVLGRARRAQA